jgi:hypothetical protein
MAGSLVWPLSAPPQTDSSARGFRLKGIGYETFNINQYLF